MLGARATWALWARPRPSEAAPVRGRARPWLARRASSALGWGRVRGLLACYTPPLGAARGKVRRTGQIYRT